MHRMQWIAIGLCCGLFACGGPADDAVDSDYTDADAGEEGVFDPMVGTLERAESVQDMNLDRKARMDEALDE